MNEGKMKLSEKLSYIYRVCNKCGELNNVSRKNIIIKEVYDSDGKYYKVIYYKCKRCGEINVVQIDDSETIQIFRLLKNLTITTLQKQIKKETIGKRIPKRQERLSKSLKQKRKALEEICEGKKMFDKNGNVFIEKLTFCKDGDIIESDL